MADKKEWTVMVYLAGDNNLSEEMVTALIGMKNAMAKLNSGKDINLVAVYDSGYPTVLTTHYRFTKKNSGKPLEASIIKYKHPQKKLRKRSEIDESASIIDFVRWASSNWKAENYALILSGHSDGIIGRTMLRDYNPPTALNLSSLERILRKSQSYLGKNKKFSLLGFDSCLMNMVEVGYELQDIADVMVASQGNVPTSGWAYDKIFESLIEEINDNGELSDKKFAASIVDKFIDYSKDYNIGGRSVNISACDLSKTEDLWSGVNDLAETFNEILNAPIEFTKDAEKGNAQENALLIERLKNLVHKSHYYSQTFMYEQAVDISDFANTISSNCELVKKEIELLCGQKPDTQIADLLNRKLAEIKEKCKNVTAQVNQYVFAHGMCGAEYQFSSGVSIFFPWTLLALYMVYGRYKNLKFSKNSAWFDFIEKYVEMTYRATGEPVYRKNLDYLQWRNDVAHLQHKDVSAKDVSAKDVSAKDVSAKDVSAKEGSDEFYRFFKRFRNHPIYHDVVIKKSNEFSA